MIFELLVGCECNNYGLFRCLIFWLDMNEAEDYYFFLYTTPLDFVSCYEPQIKCRWALLGILYAAREMFLEFIISFLFTLVIALPICSWELQFFSSGLSVIPRILP